MDDVWISLGTQLEKIPASEGVYRLYRGARLLHIGMAAGAATLRSELLLHAHGEYGPATQQADRVDWEVSPDALSAYEIFLALYAEATYSAWGPDVDAPSPSASRRHAPAALVD